MNEDKNFSTFMCVVVICFAMCFMVYTMASCERESYKSDVNKPVTFITK